jgi:Leucine-rich repeat (LRR) protein
MNKIILIGGIVFIALVAIFLGKDKGLPKFINNLTGDGTTISGDKVIDLSNQGLVNIPSSVFNQTSLEELDISHNLLTGAIPAEIRHLSNLRVLNASDNLMTGVPAEIGQLQKLETLDLSNNQLTGLPNELGNLKNLKILNLSGNQYSQQDLESIRSSLPSAVNIILD